MFYIIMYNLFLTVQSYGKYLTCKEIKLVWTD